MLNWANRFNIFCFMDNNDYQFETPAFDCMLGAGVARSITLTGADPFKDLKFFFEQKPSWLFGHLGYGLKDLVDGLSSRHKDFIDFEKGFFFEPEIILQIKGDQLSISGEQQAGSVIFRNIIDTALKQLEEKQTPVQPRSNMSRQTYIETVEAIQKHIRRGDCYEINFCQQFSDHHVNLQPLQTYQQLISLSPNPFSVLYKLNSKYCLCASPERYLKKTGNLIISQPIKGTSKRTTDKVTDDENKNYLLTSAKERSENVMIVDLVRNDLSRISKKGTVVVEELFGVYSFPQVHQMISTIKADLADGLHWTDAIRATFPMGSMTGAPKRRVMQLIDQYEPSARGLFSGSIGYITPEANFDFNVVIRSIFYDAESGNLSFSAGGGITANSNPEDEYTESLLKAEAMMSVLKKIQTEL